MKRRFKLKINGDSPRSLYLAYVLSKLRCDIYIDDLLIDSNSEKDYQIFLFSNSSKNLLSKFDIWNEIEDISYGFNSLSIRDNLVSEQLLIKAENLTKKYFNEIGWTAKYSDIKNLLIDKLINSDNVQFISENQLIDKSYNFDYEFNFKSYNNNFNSFKLPIPTSKRLDEQILIFNVYLRGHVEKRLYEINTSKGLLVLTPLNKNLYQVVWNYSSFRTKETSLSSKSLFLDNLTTLLPNDMKIDQIIGEINILHMSNVNSNFIIKNNSIYFNENKFKSNAIYAFNFDILIKNILKIYNYFDNNNLKNFAIINYFLFYYLLSKYVDVRLNLSLVNILFHLFKVNNPFSLFLRKVLFTLLKRINLIKIIVMNNLNNSIISRLLK
tara:strand:- start:332 stop:1477 length:1146 start_codon:yes stop_codon:yes gene_type:complete